MARTDHELTFRLTTANRLLAADMFERLDEQQWAGPSLCEGWSVREVAAHLAHPLVDDLRMHTVLRSILRYRGDLDRLIEDRTQEMAARPTDEIVRLLRELADKRVTPPFVGPGGQLADSCIHLRDAARPLGLDTTPPADAWRAALAFLTSPQGTRGFLPRGRLRGLRLEATDLDWSWGDGKTVSGPAEALALAVSGRDVALPELSGPGVDVLGERLRS